MDVASAEIRKVAKLCWENLPRLCQVVAEEKGMLLVDGRKNMCFGQLFSDILIGDCNGDYE